jgi:hypothetical protein
MASALGDSANFFSGGSNAGGTNKRDELVMWMVMWVLVWVVL